MLLACCLLSGCGDGTPKGQVLARVGEKAITRLDFNAERAADPAGAAGRPAPRSQLLERAIDRALLVRVARRQKLHLTPEYHAAVRRGDDDLLIAQLRSFIASDPVDPTPQELDRFIATHPWMFAERQQLVLDQIVPAQGAAVPAAVAQRATMDAVAQALDVSRSPFQRSIVMIDSGTLPDAEAQLLTMIRLGAPQSIGAGKDARFVAVASRARVPIKGELARHVAREVIRRYAADRALDRLLAAERARTDVRYRADLAPAARQ